MHLKGILPVVAVNLAVVSSGFSALIVRDVAIDLLADGRVIPFSRQPAWEGEVRVKPVTLAVGWALASLAGLGMKRRMRA